jgi:CRISPR/Cas system endoribonuclease Cas6 (RAMP superfamily)
MASACPASCNLAHRPPSSGAGDSDLERRVHSQSQIELHALTESTREEEEFQFRSISVRVVYRVQQAGRGRCGSLSHAIAQAIVLAVDGEKLAMHQ